MPVQVVFVHGVANRRSPTWDKAQTQRDELFEKLLFGDDANIANPYWGELGAKPGAEEWLSLPDYEAEGAEVVERLSVNAQPAADTIDVRLAELAAENFSDTVDAVFAEVFDYYTEGGVSIPADVIDAAKLAAAYAAANPTPGWISKDLSDDAFFQRLQFTTKQYAEAERGDARSAEVETLSIVSFLKNGATRLVDRVRNAGGRLVLANSRDALHDRLAQFVGDVFVYLKDDSAREPIRSVIRPPIQAAVETGDPIVLIGHSMGGVILADCLGDPDFCSTVGLTGPKQVDALVTVGSQPGFFQELNLLGMQGNGRNKPKLSPVKLWLNVIDELDVLSFRAGPLFDGVTDYVFSSGTGLLDAHSAYFKRNQFYHRLRVRLGDAGLPVANGNVR